jgi:hypothetical protein
LGNILLVCVYLPPKKSSSYVDEQDGMVILKEKLLDLRTRYPDHKLLVTGDLNARTGSLQDFLVDDASDYIPGMDWYIPDDFDIPRCSKDRVVNDFGQGLIDLCTEMNIHILNGRAYGDNPGQFTNITESGCSTVDYVIIDTKLYETVDKFEVSEFAETNHFPVSCILNWFFVNTDHAANNNNNVLGNEQQLKFKWQPELKPGFLATLLDDVTTADLSKLPGLIETDDLDEAVQVFESVIHRAAEPMQIKFQNRAKKQLQPKWWEDCDRLKVNKHEALKAFKTSNSEHDLREYKTARSAFKNLCSQKSVKWKDELRERLIASKTDPTQFWKTVKSISTKHFQATPISPVEWFAYFDKLLNQDVEINVEFSEFVDDFLETHDSECNTCTHHDQAADDILNLNAQITSDEIVQCIKEMSNGKAGGIDGIVIEMLKASLHITEPYLRHLYNGVLLSGKFPDRWCKAILAPIHKKGSVSDPNNYRGIALLSVVGKIFTKIINKRLVDWAEENEERGASWFP